MRNTATPVTAAMRMKADASWDRQMAAWAKWGFEALPQSISRSRAVASYVVQLRQSCR